MSIEESLGSAMMDVAGSAMLAHKLRGQQDSLIDANEAIADWMKYASRLENHNSQLQQLVNEQSAIIDDLVVKQASLEENRETLQTNLGASAAQVARLKAADEQNAEHFMSQVRYQRDLKARLDATERALRHASAQAASLEKCRELFVNEKACIDDKSTIMEQTQVVMNKAYQDFIDSGRLTSDADTQRILDDLKIKAPDFKPGLMN